MHHILFATEGAPQSAAAIEAFANLMAHRPTRITVLSVIPPYSGLGRQAGAEYYQAETGRCQAVLSDALTRLAQRGHQAESQIRMGEPAESILETAREADCDLIVMGTHARQGVGRWLNGSVAHTVVDGAPCGVVIYPWAALEARAQEQHRLTTRLH